MTESVAEEQQYLDIVRRIIDHGETRHCERTGVGTRSLFGLSMRFSLRDGKIPLITTKRVFWKGVVEELVWFLHGQTDSSILSDKGVRIWDANTTREQLSLRGLDHYPAGECGPIYGYQWRRWNAAFCPGNPFGSTDIGIDQLKALVDGLMRDPEGRRHILTAWNVEQLPEMVLPPCHCFAQFYASSPDARGRRTLSCQMYQRSADMGLGVPFNIASYSLLTHIIARACDMDPGDFIHVLGDAHVYETHVDALEKQLERVPRATPRLRLKQGCLRPGCIEDIDALSSDDIFLEGYDPYPRIEMEMAE